MAFTKSTEDLNVIQKLSDEPNDVDGLTAAQLKARFDEGVVTLQRFVNALISEIEASSGAGSVGASDPNGKGTSVQSELERLTKAINEAVLGAGGVPVGGVAGATLLKASDADYDVHWGVPTEAFGMFLKRYRREFSASDWEADGTLTIALEEHEVTGTNALTCSVFMLRDGDYVQNTWAVIGTTYDVLDNRSVVLKSASGYDGAVVITG